jgi:hypothetical protein
VSARIGVVFRPDFRPDTLREKASAAERAGVAELWLWEDCFLQGGIAAASVALSSSEALTVVSMCCAARHPAGEHRDGDRHP